MIEKINWDSYYMSQAFLISQKSIDPSTKHGAVWVSKYNRILSVGYNGPIQNIDDSKVPLTRPDKYAWFIHSEENALLSYRGDMEGISDSKIYITGRPCYRCLRMIIQKGIKKIIYAGVGSFCIDDEDLKVQAQMLSLRPDIELIQFKDIDSINKIFINTIEYIKNKY